MIKAILGKKIGMTQVFSADGKLIPVTVIEAGPCAVVQKKTVETDGYNAVQVGFGFVKTKHSNKAKNGHFAKAGVEIKKFLKEFRTETENDLNVGDVIDVSVFAEGDAVDVSGISKGHGTQGVIRRYGQHRGPMTHGSGYHRGVGSMGSASDPSRVMKGKHLAGHMGVEKVTIQNLDVVRVDVEKNIILVRGAVPGNKGGLVVLKNSVKA